MTIQWRDSSSTVPNSIEEPLELWSLIQIPADFQVMQLQLKTLDGSLEELTLIKVYGDLVNAFSLSNSNFLPPHSDKEERSPNRAGMRKTTPFGPLYKLSEYQLKTLCKYIDNNLANSLFNLLNHLTEHLSCLPLDLMGFYGYPSINVD